MKTILAILCCALTLTACDQPNGTPMYSGDPDIRVLKGFSSMSGDVASRAVRACSNEGKKIEVISTSTQPSMMSDRQYPVIIFRCVPIKE